MSWFYKQEQPQQNPKKPQQLNDADKTRKELNARKQLMRLDDHLNSDKTTVRLDKVTSNKDGTKRSRYIISENGCEKYVAKFREHNNKQELEQIVLIKRTKKHQKQSSRD